MRLAIPSAPRPVRLSQVPGALNRLGTLAGGALVLALGLGLMGRWAGGAVNDQQAFLGRAVEVKGQVVSTKLPSLERRERDDAQVTVIYVFNGSDFSRPVAIEGVRAEVLSRGASVVLLVDPREPAHAEEALHARAQRGLWWLASVGVGLGLLIGLAGLALELRRAVRSELEPLRKGALVWLTPDGPLPDTRSEVVFLASYWRDDVQLKVQARARPGRAPVRNGEKLLAAVVPSQPTWVRVVDEDLARTLGWYA